MAKIETVKKVAEFKLTLSEKEMATITAALGARRTEIVDAARRHGLEGKILGLDAEASLFHKLRSEFKRNA